MAQPDIKAEKINSPIQLMAAWFVMLILLTGVLLTAAVNIQEPVWASGYLVISTTILILLVIVAVFLMLTVFRPNLQAGREYAEWLKDQNAYSEGVIVEQGSSHQLDAIKDKIDYIKETLPKESEKNAISLVEDALLYSVTIKDISGAVRIQKALRKLGVDSKLHEPLSKRGVEHREQDSIWLGKHVPANVAVPIIMSAINVWPNLKYVAFPSDNAPEEVQWNIFIGGASETSIKRGYGVWEKTDFEELEGMSTEQLHRKLNRKNS